MSKIDTWSKKDYIYMDCSIKMSQKAMANLLYAVIITHSDIPTTYGVGIYEYTRSQNSYNMVDVKIHIHPSKINEFEELSGVKLEKPIQIQLNCE